ncbi:MAG: rRNA adenine N-6-methyltransferase family protein, partial [Candidatus Saccharimonadales bacterium]
MSHKLNLAQDKSLGQHWLVDQDILKQISESLNLIDVETYDLILEIGPGRGALTQYLLKVVKSEGKHLVAVEFDDRMYAHLQKQYPS